MIEIPEYIEKIMPDQPRENDEGNREYKWKLVNYGKIHRIATQIHYRLFEGDGKAIYLIGVSDHGKALGIDADTLTSSITYLYNACTQLTIDTGSSVMITKIRIYNGREKGCYVAAVRLKRDR